ncbi:hypothetical protein HPY42_05605 [Coprothermobacteraceae bacterium]|nr:hypothetical protein [Coprothermobacteraceae bacterium]
MTDRRQLLEKMLSSKLSADEEEQFQEFYRTDPDFRKEVDQALARKASNMKQRFHEQRKKRILQVTGILLLSIALIAGLWLANPSAISTSWLADFNLTEALALFAAYCALLWFLGRQ